MGRPPGCTLHTQQSGVAATQAEVASAGRPNAANTAAGPEAALDALVAVEKAERERMPVFVVGMAGMSAAVEQG